VKVVVDAADSDSRRGTHGDLVDPIPLHQQFKRGREELGAEALVFVFGMADCDCI
jgi:hypothetical protein